MREPVEALPDELRALLEREREGLPIPRRADARLAARLASLPVALPGMTPSMDLGSRLARLLGRRLTIALVSLGVGGGVGARLAGRFQPAAAHPVEPQATETRPARAALPAPPPPAAPRTSSARAPVSETTPGAPIARRQSAPPIAPAPPPRPVAAPPSPLPVAPAPPVAVSAPSIPPAAPAAPSIADERQLLETARVALLRGDASSGLEALTRHAEEYPAGALAEERESLTIQALAQAGRRDAAEQLLHQFEANYPKSLSLPALRLGLSENP
ncbi:MAG: hypothetical protein ACYCWW_09810 [Deltaproteobacteria bacterium]